MAGEAAGDGHMMAARGDRRALVISGCLTGL